MKAEIVHEDGRRIDLAGSVDPDTYAELERIRSPRLHPVLRCGGCGGGIYLQHGRVNKDELFGYHHSAGACTVTFVVRKSVMSDEHKREAEYHARAAERNGHVADFEVVTTGNTRVDVVVDGHVGFEIQRSALSKAAAMDRTARSVRAGLATVAWFTDKTTSSPWTGHVPGYRTVAHVDGWQVLPQPGTVRAGGLQVVEAVRCGTRGPCLHRMRSCNRFIPWLDAWTGVHVDDVVTGLAEDAIKPVRIGKYVRLLAADSVALYEELTGRRLGYDPGQPKSEIAPSARQECGRPVVPSAEVIPPPVWHAPQSCIRCHKSPPMAGVALCAGCDEAADQLIAALQVGRKGS